MRLVQPRYEWLRRYAFVKPETGHSRFWLAPLVSKDAYQCGILPVSRPFAYPPIR